MPTSGVTNGTKFRLYIDVAGGTTYVAVARATEFEYEIVNEQRDISSSDSGGYKEYAESWRGMKMSINALYAESGAVNAEDFIALVEDASKRGLLTFKGGSTTSGDSIMTGTAFINSIRKNGSSESNVSFSVALTCTGAWTSATAS